MSVGSDKFHLALSYLDKDARHNRTEVIGRCGENGLRNTLHKGVGGELYAACIVVEALNNRKIVAVDTNDAVFAGIDNYVNCFSVAVDVVDVEGEWLFGELLEDAEQTFGVQGHFAFAVCRVDIE